MQFTKDEKNQLIYTEIVKIFKISQNDSEQTFILEMSYSWLDSEMVFPLPKFCLKLVFEL